tara:strand:+ start:73 stop:273 length:201 start_codon:yes stop_codon:yes gene_type:complete
MKIQIYKLLLLLLILIVTNYLLSKLHEGLDQKREVLPPLGDMVALYKKLISHPNQKKSLKPIIHYK